MAHHDLAVSIVQQAQREHDAQHTSYLQLNINHDTAVPFNLTKTRKYVKIHHINKDTTYKITLNKLYDKQLLQIWRLILCDELNCYYKQHNLSFLEKGCGIAWYKNKGGPICLFEYTPTVIQLPTGITKLLDFVCLVSDPNVTLE
jgi:hypothetical protein